MSITIYPDEYNNTDIIIKDSKGIIKVISPKDKDIIKVLKEKGYKWDYDKFVWTKEINSYTGAIEERIAEIANTFLLKKYCVVLQVENADLIKEKAINGDFEPEHDRWIDVDENFENFILIWRSRTKDNEKIYREAKRLKESHWKKKTGMIVPINYYEEVLDFAYFRDFKFTENANKAIELRKEKMRSVTFVKIQSPTKENTDEKLNDILNSSEEILDDLKDED